MGNQKKFGLNLVLAGMFLSVLSCSIADDREVASIGDNSITVANVVDVMSSGGYEENEQGAREALDYLIDFQLILMEARNEGLDSSPEYQQRMEEAKNQLLIRKLIEVEVHNKAIPTEEDLMRTYEERGGDREEIRTRHIMAAVPAGAPEEEDREKREKIEKVLAMAGKGEDFAELAREYSEGPSAPRGGDLGFRPKGTVDPDYEEAAFALQPGEISDIVRTKFGYHIIKLEERRIRTIDDVRDNLKESLEVSNRVRLQKEFMAGVDQRADVKYLGDGIARVVELFGEDPTGAKVAEEDPVLATYSDGQYTGKDYMEFYTSVPEDLRVPPKTEQDVKGVMIRRLKDEILVKEALILGIDNLPEYREELGHLQEDVLVQLFITRQLFEVVPGDEQLISLYNADRERFPGEFEEERDNVVKMYREQMEEGGLEKLTAPLREKYPVVVLEENLGLVSRALKG